MTLNSVPENTTKVYGAYSEDADVIAGGATINLETTELSDVNLFGSYNKADETKIDISKNTLNVNVSGVKVKSVEGFANLNFKLALDEKSMLDISDSFDMNGKSFNSILPEDGFVGTQTILKAGSLANNNGAKFKINDAELNSTRTLTITTKNTDSVVYGTYTYGISSEIITLTGKSIVSAVNINSGETQATDNNTLKVTGNMAEKYTELYGAFNADGGAATFASMNGGHSKYETGSYVEADSWNIGFGLAKKGLNKKNPDTTYGLFFQYGKSSFDTHNDGGYRGDGDSKMFGAGLMFHQEARSKYYYQGSIYAGKVDAKWNCSEGGYDDDAAYWGMTFGMGRKHSAGGNKTMDVYGRYSFNHVGSMNGDLNGLKYSFDSTDSHNLRFGFRMEYAKKNAATAYWGLAWEHEFAGDSTATVATLGRTESPTLKGDSGIAEVGYQWKRGDWDYNINAEGSFGKREGVTGSFNINYNF